ncbi:hypothetical protein Sango_3058500 [Sesamum angolense]|uniref:Chromo domain-containing protein n=1 Tax=Sesamum angolense TaxID=2727404 RepID=A0AAE1VZI2_9LAMI|nr:hypothetical protein Sango_3058500 [Sesamum angolense]
MMELLGQVPKSPSVALFSLVDTLNSRVETLQKAVGEWPDMLDKRPGKHNDVADALSQKLVEEYVSALTVFESDFLDQIQESSKTDAGYLKLVEHVQSGLIRKYWLDSGLLYAKGNLSGNRNIQTWAQTELRRQSVKDMSSVIAAADRLVDFRVATGCDLEKKKKDSGKEKGKSGKGWKDGKFKKKKHQEVMGSGNKETVQPNIDRTKKGCYICNGDHRMRDCPKRGKLNALVAEADDDEGGSTRINGKAVMAMLDSGVTHNFVADREIRKLGLTLAQHSSRIKAVNSELKPIQGVACVKLKVSAWIGKCYLMAVPLDDFDVILGMDFLLLANAMDSVQSAEKKNSLISTMQEVLDKVAEMLQEFKDVFPPELQKKLPPRRAIDDGIELELGARPPAQALYRMAPAELAKLRKQLDGLLEARLVQPSKAPYGSPVLFQKKQDDLRSGYWQVRVARGDEPKTMCVTRSLKQAISSQPVLKLPQFGKPFEVQVDASDRALGGTKFIVVTDNVANTYFKTQQKLSPKQARWQEFLGEFDFEWVYRPSKHNDMADVVSQKLVEEYVAVLTVVESDFLDQNRESSKMDAGYLKLVEQVLSGLVRKYWLDSGLLYAKGGRVFVLTGTLRRRLLRETYDPQWAGHLGIDRMVALFSHRYYWPRMEEDVEAYDVTLWQFKEKLDEYWAVREALVWQACASERVTMLEWSDIVMDNQTDDRSGCQAVVCTGKHAAHSGRTGLADARAELSSMAQHSAAVCTGPGVSTGGPVSAHGQTERVNALVEVYLRHYVSASQRNWVDLMDVAQFSYKLHKSSAMEDGWKVPCSLPVCKQERLDEAKDSLAKAQCGLKKYADMGRQHVEFGVRDQVLLKLTPQIWKKISSKSVHWGLIQKYDGPFEDLLDTVGQQTQRAPPVIRKEFEMTVRKILDHRTMGQSKKNRRTDYLVHWSGESEANGTWERDVTLWHSEEKLDEYG